MPLIQQQAILKFYGINYLVALEGLESQINELPDVRVISITATSMALQSVLIIAVVETV